MYFEIEEELSPKIHTNIGEVPLESWRWFSKNITSKLTSTTCTEMNALHFQMLEQCDTETCADACSGITANCSSVLGLYNPYVGQGLANCLASFSTEVISSLPAYLIPHIPDQAFATISAQQMAALTSDQCQEITQSQLASFGDCEIEYCDEACSGLKPECVSSIGLEVKIRNNRKSEIILQILWIFYHNTVISFEAL
jgi:hypothetical protein